LKVNNPSLVRKKQRPDLKFALSIESPFIKDSMNSNLSPVDLGNRSEKKSRDVKAS